MLAKQAGYAVREVNASDERSGDALTAAVRTASGNRTLRTASDDRQAAAENARKRRASGARPDDPAPVKKAAGALCEKPTLLILDELDGADGKQAVAALVNMAKAELPKKAGATKKKASLGGIGGEEETDEPRPAKRKDGRRGPPPIQRPVICVCNDAYAPALRQPEAPRGNVVAGRRAPVRGGVAAPGRRADIPRGRTVRARRTGRDPRERVAAGPRAPPAG